LYSAGHLINLTSSFGGIFGPLPAICYYFTGYFNKNMDLFFKIAQITLSIDNLLIPLVYNDITLNYYTKNLNVKGKPVEKRGRKAKGSKACNSSDDSLADRSGFSFTSGGLTD
jgi:hypothetical protein